ncbi:unnamed protein product [Pieris brassicae]|uniref:Uncharacterized protein n=1 Tax=Pieris brassicae TaxID=7116 RepID=A0A9P0TL15_PIEBR|nr:unnamed protein product [Pieris brassicae]
MKRKVEVLEAERKQSLMQIAPLEMKLDDMQRFTKASSIEIRNIPLPEKLESEAELCQIVQNTGKALQVNVDKAPETHQDWAHQDQLVELNPTKPIAPLNNPPVPRAKYLPLNPFPSSLVSFNVELTGKHNHTTRVCIPALHQTPPPICYPEPHLKHPMLQQPIPPRLQRQPGEQAIDGLFGVVALIDPSTPNASPSPPKPHTPQDNKNTTSTNTDTTDITQLSLKLEAHSRLLEESHRAIREHSRLIKAQPTTAPADHQPGATDTHGVFKSYAKAATAPKPPAGPSIVVSGEGLETTEQNNGTYFEMVGRCCTDDDIIESDTEAELCDEDCVFESPHNTDTEQ